MTLLGIGPIYCGLIMAVLTLRVVSCRVMLILILVTDFMVTSRILVAFRLVRTLIVFRVWTVGTLLGIVFPGNSIIAGVLSIAMVLRKSL